MKINRETKKSDFDSQIPKNIKTKDVEASKLASNILNNRNLKPSPDWQLTIFNKVF